MTKTKMLVEKYRPKKFEDIIGNANIVNYIKETLEQGYLPHLALLGNAGTGKTSMAYVICRYLYGNDLNRKVLEINASVENGIDVIRNKVKDFAKYSGNLVGAKSDFKIVILDEADNITTQAQSALRRTMEEYSNNCRFIIIANYEYKIIDPILSRCKVCRFNDITIEEMQKRLSFICESEGITIDNNTLSVICERSYGDIRTAINSFIETFRFSKNKITLDSIMNIKDENSIVESILTEALNSNFLNSRKISYLALEQGMDIKTLLKRLHFTYINSKKFPELMKGELSEVNEKAEFNILSGCSSDIVLSALLSKIGKIGLKYKPKGDK